MSKKIKWIGGTKDVPALNPPRIKAGDVREVEDGLAEQFVSQKLAEIEGSGTGSGPEKKSKKKDKEGGDN